MLCIRRLTVVIYLAIFTLAIGGFADTKTPPRAQIVYTTTNNQEPTSGLIMFDWPDGSPLQVHPKIIGKWGIGDQMKSPIISPDGSYVIFLANRRYPNGKQVEVKNENVGLDIWLYNIKSNIVKPLTVDGKGYALTHWSPDGRFVSFISNDGYYGELLSGGESWDENLHVYNLQTGKSKLLKKNVYNYVWINDGKHILYESQFLSSRKHFFIVDASNSRFRSSRFPSDISTIDDWSSNNRYMSYRTPSRSGIRNLGVYSPATGKSKLIVKNVAYLPSKWSPNSSMILFSKFINGVYSLCVFDFNSGSENKLWDLIYEDAHLRWSKNGEWIIASGVYGNYKISYRQLVAIPVKGGNPITIIQPSSDITGMDWHELN